jgi:undecaprenyl pyrophosphate phosphatase UppP
VLLWGGVVALLSGLAAIWLFVHLLRGLFFYRFAYYTWAVGSVFLIWLALV